MFEINYEESTNQLMPEGEYECVILSAYVNSTKSGKLYFSVRFAVRNDVPQKYKNKNIFHAIWQRKPEKQTADDKKVDGYSYKQLMSLCEAAGLPKGKSYESLNALGKDLEKKCVLVTIEHDSYNGETREKVQWTNKTNYPECKHVFKNTANSPLPPLISVDNSELNSEDDDGDLPF